MQKITWDALANTEAYAEYLMDENSELTENDAFEQACESDQSFEWDCFIDNLTEFMRSVSGYSAFWKVEASNMGWQHRSGHKYFEADNASELIRAILPDVDFTLRIKQYSNRIEIVASHHDAPTGEFYTVKPVTHLTYERNI